MVLRLRRSPLYLDQSFGTNTYEWQSVNVPPNWPGKKDGLRVPERDVRLLLDVKYEGKPKPVCPHYQLIELAAELAGIGPEKLGEEPEFCGVRHFYTYRGGCFGGHREYGRASGTSACARVLSLLQTQLRIVALSVKEVSLPSLEKAGDELDALKQARQTLQQRISQRETEEEKKTILARWREIVFRVSCVPTRSTKAKNPHFRRISSAEALSEEEVLNKVRALTEGLSKQVVGLSVSITAEFCPIAPKINASRW